MKKKKTLRGRERGRNNLFCMEKYAKNKREWQIYSKRLGIQ